MTIHTLANLLVAPPLWLALLLSAAFAGQVRALRLVTQGGAFSTFLVGFVVFGLGGGKFAVPLLTFFFTASLLSRLEHAQPPGTPSVKGATRDAAQVWANGGMAVALTLAFALLVHRWPLYKTRYLLMLYLAALATVNADTWATEIGGLSRRAPRLLTNWRTVAPGTSGAITGLGVLAALAGAAIIPLSAYLLWHLDPAEFVAVAWAGFLGSCIDSLLGAGVQAKYRHPITGELTERKEGPGSTVTLAHGFPWIDNDVVNFLASVGGVICAWLLLRYSVYRFY